MTDTDTENLQEELRHFREEKEKIRTIVGQIGGQKTQVRIKIVNIVFICLILMLLGLDLSRHVMKTRISRMKTTVYV